MKKLFKLLVLFVCLVPMDIYADEASCWSASEYPEMESHKILIGRSFLEPHFLADSTKLMVETLTAKTVEIDLSRTVNEQPNMTKEEYLKSLDDIISSEIFITSETNILDKEVAHNKWNLSITQDLAGQLSVEDLVEVSQRIVANRAEQLSISDEEVDLLFYMWHDAKTSELIFTSINSNHGELPFTGKVNFHETASTVLSAFLNDEFHDDPQSDLKVIDKDAQGLVQIVYRTLIAK